MKTICHRDYTIKQYNYDEPDEDLLETLAEITRAAFAEYSKDNINFRGVDMSADLLNRSIRRTEQTVFVLEKEGKPVAYCRGYMAASGGQAFLHCEGVAVHPSCRRQGLAEALTGERERWGKSQGAAYAVLNTSVKATKAKRFHHSHGYKDYGYTHFEGKRYLSVLMRKDYGEPYPETRRRIGLVKSWLLMRLLFTRNGEDRLWHRVKDKLLGKGVFQRRGKR